MYENFLELCANNTSKEVEFALQNGANINEKDDDGWTALMFATHNIHDPEVVAVLLEHGADVNEKNKREEDYTALMYAVLHRANPQIIKTLLDYGANIDAKKVWFLV
ncbi:hypothetical protein FACS1894187_22130 [Synergistales bacterium]|nr:hypothetical protein FACS1894187_22130 [Synergistales bacterium]